MQIKIHRGTHQIGGVVTEISTPSTRIIIDMGDELPSSNATGNSLNIEGVNSGVANCDAVFITHYHGDHIGKFDSILPTIPIYMGETAKEIFCVLQKTLEQKLDNGKLQRASNIKTFNAGKPIKIKDIKITPICVDHSAYDSYMFLIEAEGKRVLHTGDFRMHGGRGRKMPDVIKKFASNIDVLITEGTMMSRLDEDVMTMHQMGTKATQVLRQNKNVFILCSSTDIDSIAQFYSAAIKAKRPFIVCEDDYQMEILRVVSKSAKSSLYNFEKSKIYTYGENLKAMMEKYGFCMIARTNAITKKAMQNFPQNTIIYSMWQGYLDKQHTAFDKYKSEFVQNAVKNRSTFLYLHTSGHATANAIKAVCEITKAKTIIPMHTEKPENFTKLETKGKIKLLEDGKGYSF